MRFLSFDQYSSLEKAPTKFHLSGNKDSKCDILETIINLRQKEVSKDPPSVLIYAHSFGITQTLKAISFDNKKLGDMGVGFLFDVLRSNSVSARHLYTILMTFNSFSSHLPIQVIRIVCLVGNQIGDAGVQCLVAWLKDNKVIIDRFSTLIHLCPT